MFYFLTISCQQKKEWIHENEIKIIIEHLTRCGVTFLKIVYENGGIYNQLHVHAIVLFHGLYFGLTKYGDQDVDKSFQIHWKKMRGRKCPRIEDYMDKQQGQHPRILNWYKTHYFNQDNQEFKLISEL